MTAKQRALLEKQAAVEQEKSNYFKQAQSMCEIGKTGRDRSNLFSIYLQGDTLALSKDNCEMYSVEDVIRHFVTAAHVAQVRQYSITVEEVPQVEE